MTLAIGRNCKIDPTAEINVKNGTIGEDCQIGAYVRVDADYFTMGDRSILRPFSRIEGTNIELGHEAYLDERALIGGGSARDPDSIFKAGDWLHMGKGAELNQGAGLYIGHEFGVGARIFTHGGYLNMLEGFPYQWGKVKIGDRVWIPLNTVVNPGSELGDNIVIAAGSVVNGYIPSGSFASGIPVGIKNHGTQEEKVMGKIQYNLYPRVLSEEEEDNFMKFILNRVNVMAGHECNIHKEERGSYRMGETLFNISKRELKGPSTEESEIFKGELRRRGIRFRYKSERGEYIPWGLERRL
ncbi:hypothetical protein HYU23_04590 [Candidatus Woesearchaeota archaeon]|nr:hypothetical protein [Candidatus Woesearchaeota archaeon]